MGDKALRGNRLTRKDGGRTNLLEELGRVEAEHSNRNRRAEIARVHSELNNDIKEAIQSMNVNINKIMMQTNTSCPRLSII